MNIRVTLLTLLLSALPLFAEPPAAFIYYVDGVLTDDGTAKGAPLPDGTEVKIYWDADNNGPDEKDPQPVEGKDFGQANRNSFPINGETDIGVKGQFSTDPGFGIVGDLPNPPTYYLRICLDGKTLVSEIFTLKSGLQEVMIKKWTVGPKCKQTPK